jgi:MFS family permease
MSNINVAYMLSTIYMGITLALTSSVETVYFLGMGFAFVQIGFIWSTDLVTSAVLDFPTGNLADKFGRKTTFCTGLVASALGHWMYAFSQEYSLFLAGAFFLGVGSAQVSGSLGAWLIDEKKKRGEQEEVSKVFGNSKLATSVAGVVVGFLVGSLYRGPLRWLFFLSGTVTLLAAVWVWISLEDNYGKSSMKWIDFQKNTLKHFFEEKMLVFSSLIIVLVFSCFTIYIFVYQPAAVASGIKEQQLGILFSAHLIASGLGSFVFGRISPRISFPVLMAVSFIGFGCGLYFFSVNNIYVITLGLLLFSFGYGGYLPIFLAWTSKFIPTEIRASVMSLISTIGRGSIFLLQPLVGTVIDAFSAKSAIVLGECFVIGGIIIVLLIRREEHARGGAHD